MNMNGPDPVILAIGGVTVAAFVIWGIVRAINDWKWFVQFRQRRHVLCSFVVVAACLWWPFSWLILLHGQWTLHRLGWIKLWPVLPGLVAGLWFHQRDAVEYSVMGVATLILLAGLTWLGTRSAAALLAAALLALLISTPTSWLLYGSL